MDHERIPATSSVSETAADASQSPEKGLDHAWRYFALHAQQRISVFNFFVVLSGILAAGIGAGLQAGKSRAIVVAVLGGLLGLFSIVFYQLDKRGSELVKIAEVALIKGENTVMPVFSRVVAEEARRREPTTAPQNTWTFTRSFRIIFWGMGIAGAIACIFSFYQWLA